MRVLLAAFLLLLPSAAFAAPSDEDKLFTQLHDADSPETAHPLEQKLEGMFRISGSPSVDLLMTRAQAALGGADNGTAKKLLDAVTQVAPDFAEGWNRRATLYYLMGEYQKSLDDIDRTLALEPRHFGALSGLGLVNLQLDRKEAAASAWQRVLDVDPQNEGARENLDALNAVLKRESI